MLSCSEILATYPNAAHAVAFCELILGSCDQDDLDSWKDMEELDAKETLEIIRRVLEEEALEGTPLHCAEALAELSTPDFRRYLAAKKGLV